MAIKPLFGEQELLQQIAAGDQSAFQRLFDLYRPNIYTTALRILGDEWLAEEIVQDTFLKVWLKRESLKTIDNFGGWLYTIARNYTYNAIKQNQRERQQLVSLTQEALRTNEFGADSGDEEHRFRGVLNEAVNRLPEKQKQTYILIKQQEMKREEVAQQLNVSPETVKWNLDQAMKSIRKFCAAHVNEVPPALSLYFLIKYF